MSRHRLELVAKCVSETPLPPANQGENVVLFSDIVDPMSRHYHCHYGERVLTCRALTALGLPKSAGLNRRPILLCQDLIAAELTQCAEALPKKFLEQVLLPNTKQPAWSSRHAPYSIDLPQSIRSPSLVGMGRFGKLRSTQNRLQSKTNLGFKLPLDSISPAPTAWSSSFAPGVRQKISEASQCTNCVKRLAHTA